MGRRYPGVVKSKINLDGRAIGAAFAGSPEMAAADSDIPGSAEGETSELTGTQASKSRYPTYNKPTWAQRVFNPEGANQAERFNFESAMRQGEDSAALERQNNVTNNQIRLHQFDLDQQAMRKVLEREGITGDQANRIIKLHGDEVENTGKFTAGTAEQKAMIAENEPEALYANQKALLARPGVENKSLEANTAGRQILNQFLPEREPAEIEHLKAITGQVKQGTEQKGLLFPFEKQEASNKAISSGIIRFPANEVVGNAPLAINGNPINYYSVTPETKAQPAGLDMATKQWTPAIPAQAPFMNSLGTLGNLQRPTSATGVSSTTDPGLYEIRTDPVTGKQQRRLRNP